MPRQVLVSATEAARLLGISLDTLRRWDKAGKIHTQRDESNRRVVASSEIERLRGDAPPPTVSARNRLRGTVSEITVEGLLAQIEITTIEPNRVVAVITREAAEQLGLRVGMEVKAIVKATSVMVER